MRGRSQKYRNVKESEPVFFSSPLTERMINILSGDFDNRVLDVQERFFLEYLQLVIEYRLKFIQKKDTEFILEAIKIKEEVGKKIGFGEEDLKYFNVFVRNKTDSELNDLKELIDSI